MNQVKLPLNTTVEEVLTIAKRQHKELKKMLAEKSPTLMEIQNMVARSMGFKSFYDVPEAHPTSLVSVNDSEGQLVTTAPKIQDYKGFDEWNKAACHYINTVLMPDMQADYIELMAHDIELNFRLDELIGQDFDEIEDVLDEIKNTEEKFFAIPNSLIYIVKRKGDLGYGFVYYR